MKTLVLEKDRVRHNADTVREKAGDRQVIAVVKGNGYGFGIVAYTKLLKENGFDFFAVATLDEAKTLRANGIDDKLLLLSPTENPRDARDIVDLDITASIGSPVSAAALNNAALEAGKNACAHILVDTGFGRFGFHPDEQSAMLESVKSLTNVVVEGIFSHLSASFLKKKKYTLCQLEEFTKTLDFFKNEGVEFKYTHLANSCALFLYPETLFDTVRVGSALIGRLPVKTGKGKLMPCGYIEAEIDCPRYIPEGHNVGYANTCKVRKATRVAVVPLGYGDGYAAAKAHDTFRLRDRLRYIFTDVQALLKKGGMYCTVNGKRAKVLGRVGLSNCVIDVTGISCEAGDIARFEINPLYVDSSVDREYR